MYKPHDLLNNLNKSHDSLSIHTTKSNMDGCLNHYVVGWRKPLGNYENNIEKNSKYKIELMASVTAQSSKFEWYQITPTSIELNF